MFFDKSVSLHQSVSPALAGRCVRGSDVDGTTTRKEWTCKGPRIRERWELSPEVPRVRALLEYRRAVHLANSSGCVGESFGQSDKRRTRSKGKVGGQLGGWLQREGLRISRADKYGRERIFGGSPGGHAGGQP